MKDKTLRSGLCFAQVCEQLEDVMEHRKSREHACSLDASVLPPTELQRLAVIGIGVEGIEEWKRVEPELPERLCRTFDAARKILPADQFVRWLAGARQPSSLRKEHPWFPLELPPAVGLVYIWHIIKACGVEAL